MTPTEQATPSNIPSELLEDLVRGTCVVVVGSGLSASIGLPTWGKFVKKIKESIPDDKEMDATDENIANHRLEYLDYAKRRHHARFQETVKDILSTKGTSKTHELLAELPAVAIITTNLDTLVEEAFQAKNRDPIVIDDTRKIPQFQEPHRPLVIKMHGSLQSDTQVLTLSEYQDFDLKSHAMKALVLSYLIRHPLLIIGAGLTDPDFVKLYSIVHDTFGHFHHPVFYVHHGCPGFLKEVWEERNFRFISVPHKKLTDWLRNLVESVKQEKERLYSRLGISVVVAQIKKEAMLSLGNHLNEYALLQRLYTTQIHMPDYCFFTDPWEQTLYAPLRNSLASAVQENAPADVHLLYLAPGSHAPALTNRRRVVELLSSVSLMDIDPEVVKTAKTNLTSYLHTPIRIDDYTIDFTAGAGQKLCDALLALCDHSDPAHVITALSTLEQRSAILDNVLPESDIPRLAFSLLGRAREAGYQELASIAFSEMVASFTGTAVLMAFRSRLYSRCEGRVLPAVLAEVMNNAVCIWQQYNDRIYKLHLSFLDKVTHPGGLILVAVDTEKQYDDNRISPVSSFSQKAPPINDCPGLIVQDPQRALFWRDHAFGFDISIGGVPVNDFQSHRHRVELYTYLKRQAYES